MYELGSASVKQEKESPRAVKRRMRQPRKTLHTKKEVGIMRMLMGWDLEPSANGQPALHS